jgi:hypothetical protein
MLGQIEVHELSPENLIAHYVCWAVTVFRTYCTLGALRTVAREVAFVAESKPNVHIVAAPLLGSGAGGVDPMKSAAALSDGFHSANVENLILRLHVPDTTLAAKIQRTLQHTPVENVLRVPSLAKLTKLEFSRCEEALLDAFDGFELAHMIRIGLDKDLEEIANGGSLRETVFMLLQWAERQGLLTQLLQSAMDDRPNNPKLRAFVSALH